METKKIRINAEFEVPADFTGGMVDIGTEFTECIPFNSIVWYWDGDPGNAHLGIYKGATKLGYMVKYKESESPLHYEHIKLYKKGEGDVE